MNKKANFMWTLIGLLIATVVLIFFAFFWKEILAWLKSSVLKIWDKFPLPINRTAAGPKI
jgi:hypothetical protein